MQEDITTTTAYKAAEAYERFLVAGMFRYWTPLLLERATPKSGERALDVACGTGVVARSMVPLVGEQGQVVGLDINPAMLEVACRQFSDYCSDIDWREGQAENIPFPDHDFDLVTCQQGLQFFDNKALAVREMRRVLRPGGRAVVVVWQSLEANPFIREVFNTIAAVFNIPVETIAVAHAYGDPQVLKQLLVDAAFQQIKVEEVRQDAHYHEVDRYIEGIIRGASAVIPAFGRLDGGVQLALQARVSQELAGFMKDSIHDGVLSYPMAANMVTAIR